MLLQLRSFDRCIHQVRIPQEREYPQRETPCRPYELQSSFYPIGYPRKIQAMFLIRVSSCYGLGGSIVVLYHFINSTTALYTAFILLPSTLEAEPATPRIRQQFFHISTGKPSCSIFS